MRRFVLLDPDNTIAAEGVYFTSGMVAVSFCSGQPAQAITASADIESAEYVHEQLGGRRLAWVDIQPLVRTPLVYLSEDKGRTTPVNYKKGVQQRG